ncbi:MAG: DUF7346 family protein [Halovenus sp.]
MRVVSDGESYFILQQVLAEDCRLRHFPSGSVTTRPCESITPVNSDDLGEIFEEVDTDVAVSPAATSLLLELAVGGPASARELLDRFDVCESDLHGAVSELRAAGVLEPTTVYGERGYRATSEIASSERD